MNLITQGLGNNQTLMTIGLGFWEIILSNISKGFFKIRYAKSFMKTVTQLKKEKNFIYPK